MTGVLGLPVVARTARDRRGAWLGWAAAIAGLTVMLTAFYPSVRSQAGTFRDLLARYPKGFLAVFGVDAGIDFSSGTGFLATELFGFMAPLLFLIAAIGAGAGAIAGEEDRGTLDLLLANPLSRRRLVLERMAACTLELVALGAVQYFALWAGALTTGMHLGAGRLLGAVATMTLLALAFCAVALLCSVIWGRRALAAAVAAAIAATGYVLVALARLVPGLHAWQRVSLFSYGNSGDALQHGFAYGDAAVLLAATLACVAAAAVVFDRRDL